MHFIENDRNDDNKIERTSGHMMKKWHRLHRFCVCPIKNTLDAVPYASTPKKIQIQFSASRCKRKMTSIIVRESPVSEIIERREMTQKKKTKKLNGDIVDSIKL